MVLPIETANLGDNVFVTFDGYNIVLETMRQGRRHYVVLGPDQVRNFSDYLMKIREAIAGA